MMFNRHEILTAHYKAQIEEWNWPHILRDLEENSKDPDMCERDGDEVFAHLYIGSVLNLVPSGKYYTLWTTNQTRADMIRDEAWWAALTEVCDEHDCYIGSPESGDGLDVFLGKTFDMPEDKPDYMVCVDCHMYLSNDEEPDDEINADHIKHCAHQIRDVVYMGESHDEEFSLWPCSCCNSSLGGSRYGYITIEETK